MKPERYLAKDFQPYKLLLQQQFSAVLIKMCSGDRFKRLVCNDWVYKRSKNCRNYKEINDTMIIRVA